MSAPGAESPWLEAGLQEPPSQAGISVLLDQLRPRLLRLLRCHAVSLPDSEDLIQEAALALLRSWPTIRHPAAWLIGTVRHQCRLHLRRQRNKDTGVDPEQLVRLAGWTPGPQEAHHAWRVDLKRFLRALSPRQRQLVRLLYYQGLTESEAAARLGISKDALHRDRWRAIARLRQLSNPEPAAPQALRSP
jgi:RNA polymerase sigma-70 factor (ECF subfamily)